MNIREADMIQSPNGGVCERFICEIGSRCGKIKPQDVVPDTAKPAVPADLPTTSGVQTADER